jgi:periplasmic protein TonB
MLATLLESNAPRSRRTGGTLASTLVHAALFAGAITVSTRVPAVKLPPPTETLLPPVVVARPHEKPPTARPPAVPTAPPTQAPLAPRIPVVDRVPNEIPPIDVDVKIAVASNEEAARGGVGTLEQSGGGPDGPVGPTREGALEERYVDRVPRIVGNPVPPAFPFTMRDRGIGGRVAIQFVIDTLGRAEMHGLRVVEATDSLFAQSVRAVLPRYRFTPGEVRGQKVRTLVQLPFDFTLARARIPGSGVLDP